MTAASSGPRRRGAIPSMLDLMRLSRRPLFPPCGRDLYRQIAILTDMGEGDEILVAACGRGLTLDYFAREFGIHGSGVDEDEVLIEAADVRSREDRLQDRIQFQHARMDDLPYRDGVFDVVIGELGLASSSDLPEAVRELSRVLKPGGRIALVQLVWKAPVDPKRQLLLSRHLGARPVMLVELKRMLQEAGIGRLHTEAWSDEETAFRRTAKKPFPDFAELFGLSEKLVILRRAWSRWGWRGVVTAITREMEVHRLLTKERVLGLDMIKGAKEVESTRSGEPVGEWVSGKEAPSAAEGVLEEEDASEHEGPVEPEPANTQTQGLPLFTRGKER